MFGAYAASGFSSTTFIELDVRPLDLTTISFNTDSIFVPVNIPNAEVDWEGILSYTAPAVAKQDLQLYGVHYVVIDTRIPFEFQSYGYDRPSGFLVLLHTANYKVYDSRSQSMWYVG